MAQAGKRTLLLIDGSHALFRAFFAVRNLRSPSGAPTGAVFGLVSMLQKLLRQFEPTYVAACFDTAGPTFRHELDPAYKAQRPDMPEDLAAQWPVAERLTAEMGIAVLVQPGQEADDIIATLATQAHADGCNVAIVSGDKDLMQLVRDALGTGPRVVQYDDGKGLLYNEAEVQAKWGVRAQDLGDLLAIMGDSADNIPGVRGIGEKGATKLIQQFKSLAGVYEHLDEVTPPRLQQLLRDGQADAQRSRVLVELTRDAPIPWKYADLALKEPDRAALQASFAELGFKRLLQSVSDTPAEVPQAVEATLVTVTTRQQLSDLAGEISRAGQVALFAVTSENDGDRLRPMFGAWVGLALAWPGHHTAYVPLRRDVLGERVADLLEVTAILGPVLQSVQCQAVHGKYEALVLGRHGISLPHIDDDVMLASYLLEPERYGHSLRNIAYAHLNVTLETDDAICGRGKAWAGWQALPVARVAQVLSQRVAAIAALVPLLTAELREHELFSLYRDLEIPLQMVLRTMEQHGIAVDVAELARQSAWLAEQIAKQEAEIHALAGERFGIGSPQQLGKILFEKLKLPAKKKTQTGWSTDQSVLETLDHPIASQVLRWRQLTKLKSTYTDALPLQIQPQTHRIHTCFQQAVAATGRLSSIEPNLQNIPVRSQEGRRIRQAFVTEPGWQLLSADYSQVELRVMAHLAHDPGLLAAFQRGLDIHRETAAQIFGVLPELITTAERSSAKAIVFGILYGMGSQRLAREIGVSPKEAKAFIERYFQRFPAVQAFVEQTVAKARETGEVRTLYGRRRPVPGLHSESAMERAGAERVAVNTPVQGTAADLIKRAMLTVDAQLRERGLRARLLLQVHDELLLEVPDAELPEVTELVRQAMMGAGDLAVPLQVDARAALNWALAH